MAEALYTIEILRLAAQTGAWPPLAEADGSAERRSPTCGSRVRVDVRLGDDGRVAALGLSVSACALGQASAALLAQSVAGRDVAEIAAARDGLADYLAARGDSLPDWPGIDVLAPARAYPARHPSLLLPFDAALAALADAETGTSGARAHG